MKHILIVIILIMGFLTGCAHKITFTNFQSGEILNGEYNTADESIKVTMPNGEILLGKYSTVSSSSMVFGNSFSNIGGAPVTSFGTGVAIGGGSKAYAILSSQKSSLMLELLVSYSEWDGHGFGEARTNDGRTYKVQF